MKQLITLTSVVVLSAAVAPGCHDPEAASVGVELRYEGPVDGPLFVRFGARALMQSSSAQAKLRQDGPVLTYYSEGRDDEPIDNIETVWAWIDVGGDHPSACEQPSGISQCAPNEGDLVVSHTYRRLSGEHVEIQLELVDHNLRPRIDSAGELSPDREPSQLVPAPGSGEALRD